ADRTGGSVASREAAKCRAGTGAPLGGPPERFGAAVPAWRERRPGPLDDAGPGGRRPPFPRGPSPRCTPERIRTAVTALRERRPGPLDDGGIISSPRARRLPVHDLRSLPVSSLGYQDSNLD